MSKTSPTFAGNVFKLVTGNILAQGLGVLIAPIVTRFFAPEAFGVAALFVSITGIIGVVACLRYESAIMLPKTDEEAANLLSVSICFVLTITGISALITYFGRDIIVGLLNSPELKKYCWLVPIAVFINGVFLALNYWNSRTKHFGRLSIAQVVSSSITQATKLAAGFTGHGSGGILIGTNILGRFVSTSVLGGQIWIDGRRLFKVSIRLGRMIAGMKRYSKFPLIDVWGGLLNKISWQLPALLLSAFFSPIVVGYYALGTTVTRVPMSVIGDAIARVFYQKACDAKNNANTSEVAGTVFRGLVAIGLCPMLILCLIGQDLFFVVFGHNWSEAGRYTQILAPWMFFTFISSPLSRLFFVFEKQGAFLIVHSLIFVTRLISLYIGGILGDVYVALGLFSGTGVIVYGSLSVQNMKLAGLPPKFVFKVLFRYFCYFAPIFFGLIGLKYWFEISGVAYLLIAVLLTACYELVVIFEDGPIKIYVSKIINRKNFKVSM